MADDAGLRHLCMCMWVPLLILSLAAGLSGQSAPTLPPPPRPTDVNAETWGTAANEFAIRAGGSFFSGHTWGRTRDRTLALLELRYTRFLLATRFFSMKYAVNLVPVAFFGDHAIFASDPAQRTQRQYVYGGGMSPVGFQFTFRRGKRIQPFIVTDEGFLYFSRRILNTESSQFNFTIDYGAGLQVFTSPRRAISFGYRYYHISNADIAINPGTDANLFFAGVSFLR